MARKQPVPEAKRAECEQIAALRKSLLINRTEFSRLVGMGAQLLAMKEFGRVPLRADELEKIKTAVAAHLARSKRAYEQTFGPEPATVTQ